MQPIRENGRGKDRKYGEDDQTGKAPYGGGYVRLPGARTTSARIASLARIAGARQGPWYWPVIRCVGVSAGEIG